MAQHDLAKVVKTALADFFDGSGVAVTLEVPDNYNPLDGQLALSSPTTAAIRSTPAPGWRAEAFCESPCG